MAAGMATKGLRPVCAIYSTFLQRAYDQIIHDVCLQNLPVTLCLDRAGLSPNDGPTHHGVFDLSYFYDAYPIALSCNLLTLVNSVQCLNLPSSKMHQLSFGTPEVPVKVHPWNNNRTIKLGKAEVKLLRKYFDSALGEFVSLEKNVAQRIEVPR